MLGFSSSATAEDWRLCDELLNSQLTEREQERQAKNHEPNWRRLSCAMPGFP